MEVLVDLPEELEQFWKDAIKQVLGKDVLDDWSVVSKEDWEVVLAEFNRRAIEHIKQVHGVYDQSLD